MKYFYTLDWDAAHRRQPDGSVDAELPNEAAELALEKECLVEPVLTKISNICVWVWTEDGKTRKYTVEIEQVPAFHAREVS